MEKLPGGNFTSCVKRVDKGEKIVQIVPGNIELPIMDENNK